MTKKPKVAIATEFLTQMGGAQKTLEAILELYPDAPVYTAKYDPTKLEKTITSRKIIFPKDKFINKIGKHFFVFTMSPIFENFDFRDFDLVISDGTTWNKGILTKPDQLHITYIHTPPRFLYGYSREGTKWDKGPLRRFIYSYMANILRLWDYVAAQRPDFIVANSKEIQKRIKKFYGRDSTVIYPPVEVNYKTPDRKPDVIDKPYFLATGRLVTYKNFDILIEAFNKLGWPLVVVGTGSEENKLRAMAKENIIFTGRASEDDKHVLMEHSLGLINMVEDEDFGIVPIEIQAHGKPALVHRSAGHLETVTEGLSGMYFENLEIDHLVEKIKQFKKAIDEGKFDSNIIKENVQKYSKERFKKEFSDFVESKLS
ncbi:glycosyltransferase [Patescibacteria group bacterium]|nr:glycosyltransferase [Patescibacteria group bacterium]